MAIMVWDACQGDDLEVYKGEWMQCSAMQCCSMLLLDKVKCILIDVDTSKGGFI